MGCPHSVLVSSSSEDGSDSIPELLVVKANNSDQSKSTSGNEESADDEAIAIIGIACKTPGAENIRDFWRILLNGENHITEVPPSRWNGEVFYDEDPNKQGKTNVRRAGFVKGYGVTGATNAILAARVSYVYNFQGPCMVLDTACSSALVCIHAGAQAIRNGDCDMAVCGGTNYMGNPGMFVQLSKSAMISPEGLSKTFSAKADGYARAEGCGIVVLKRCRNPAGDPVEANALGKFLKEASDPRTRYIGSVKTNVGHLESASGAIGVIKVLLMMNHDLIVPSLLWGEVNPQINLNELGLIIPRQPIKWKKEEKMACCNSFGFGGTNAHAVFQTHQLRHHKDKNTSRHESSIICFSGKSIHSLKQSMEMMSEEEALVLNGSFKSVSEAEEHLIDISYTGTVRRDHHRFRKAFIVEDIHDLIDNVSQCLADGVVTKAASDPHIVFVFCGMGTAWPGMCLQMMDEFPSFRDAIQEIDALLKKFTKGQWSLVERFKNEDCSKDDLLSPIAIFACQVALVAVWKSLGVIPACVLGQSVGEVAAAYVAGCISLESAVAIIYFRSQILTQVSGGKMIVVKNINVEKVRAALKDFKNANISLEYSPVSCAVSADPATLTKVRQKLSSISASDGSQLQVISLDVPVAYHSQFVDPCIAQLARALEKLQSSPPTVQYISAVSGEELTVAPDQRYWTTHLREPVLFSKAVKTARKKNPGKTVFLEIGPRAVLKAHIHDIFPNEDVPVVTSMSKQPEKKVFLQATASLYELGSDIQWEALFKTSHEITELPRYVFDKKTSLRRSEIQAMLLSGTPMVNHHLFLYPITVKTRDLFKIVLSTFTTSFVYDHIVGHTFVIPGALYLEAGFAIAKLLSNDFGNQALISATFMSPVSADKDDLIELDIKKADIPSLSKESSLQFDIVRNDRLVVNIKVDHLPPATCAPDQISLLHIKQKCKQLVVKDTIQTALRNLNFNFGESFSLLDHAFKGDRECLACIKPSPKVCQDFISTTIHPAVLDAMMQSSVVLMGNSVKVEQQHLPEAVNKLKVFGKMETCMYVHTRIASEENKRVRYSCVLYSADGHTLAILDEYVVNKINAESDCNLPMLMTMKWDPVSDSWDRDVAVENALILVTSSDTDMPTDNKMKMIGKSHHTKSGPKSRERCRS
ncbi:hypothetical protein C0Q70_12503 [Pomacea canaliculata]|uniref:Carrier domain-containing protein n=1 Tax=Pomacea canaliculata TaxID=400727 RepID=A0A2T7P1Q1_POMCA|nr:hypothetical protein C0Q70_12503 [Pomacea canaliculata]